MEKCKIIYFVNAKVLFRAVVMVLYLIVTTVQANQLLQRVLVAAGGGRELQLILHQTRTKDS